MNSNAGNVVSTHRGILKPKTNTGFAFLQGIYVEEVTSFS